MCKRWKLGLFLWGWAVVASATSLYEKNPFGFYLNEDLNRLFYNGRDPLVVDSTPFKSGLLRLEYSLDDGPYVSYGTPLKLTEEGHHTLQYRVVDSMEQTAYVKQIRFYLDTTAPETRLIEKGEVSKKGDTYYLSNAKALGLDSYDALSGVDYMEYSHDGKTFDPYFTRGEKAEKMEFLKEGKNVLYYRAVDNVGNFEKVHAINYVLSSQPPSTAVSVAPEPIQKGTDYFIGVQHEISLKAKPAEIPIAKIMVNLDGEEFVYSKPFRVALPGRHKLSYYAIDEAGNKEEANIHEFYTDDTPPQTAYEYNGTILDFSEMVLAGSDFSLKLSASDEDGAELKEINYSFGSARSPASVKNYENPITLEGDGLHQIHVRAVDRVGNKEKEKVFAVVSDQTPPKTQYKPLIPFKTVGGQLYSSYPNAVILEASDNISGVKSVLYSLNGEDFEEYVGPIKLPHKETNELRFRSKDALGNAEKEQTLAIHMIGADLNIKVVDRTESERAVASE